MKPWLKPLERVLGTGRVCASHEVLSAHAGDTWFAAHMPDAVVFADSTSTVCRTLKFASRHGIPVTPRGAGKGCVGGCVPSSGGIVISTAKMNRILEIHEADAVAVVEPGVITGDLQAAVKAQGLFYPPDPASLKECFMGGNVATNAGGPRCLKYGVTRNYILGLEVVLSSGAIVRTGARTIKNKTGWDMTGLFVGSEGLLGVITKITVRLLPQPPARAVLSAGFKSDEQAAHAIQCLLKSGVGFSALEVADAFTLESARKHIGASQIPEGDAHILAEIDGTSAAVRAGLNDARAMLQSLGAISLATAKTESSCAELWQLRRTFSAALKATGLTKLNEDVTVPRGRLVDLFRLAGKLRKKYGVPVACFGHAGDGNIHTNLMADMTRPGAKAKMTHALDELFDQVLAWQGSITGEHGIGLAKKRWWKKAASPELRKLHERIKAAIDPMGIMNPGKFVDLP